MKRTRRTVIYDRDLLYYYDDEILIFVKDGETVGSMTTGLDIISIGISNLKDSLCIASKKDKLEIIDSMIEQILEVRRGIENE